MLGSVRTHMLEQYNVSPQNLADALLNEEDRTPMYCRPKWYAGVALLATAAKGPVQDA